MTYIFKIAIATCLILSQPAIAATVEAQVDVSEQKMLVLLDGTPVYAWPVSTARNGKVTPRGEYGVELMRKMHYSSLYNNAPMPHSIFFRGNYAIHGTNHIKRLGTPASAGCVRLHPDHAETLFGLVKEFGRDNTQIKVLD